MTNKSRLALALVSVLVLVAVLMACTPTPTPTPSATPTPKPTTSTPTPTPTATAKPTTTATAAPTATPTATPKPSPVAKLPPKPDIIKMGGYDIGSAGYIIAAAQGEGIQKMFGTKIRYLPQGTGVARTLAAKIGTTDVAAEALDMLFAAEGLYDFSVLQWGPQPLRLVYFGDKLSPYSMVTYADSGIKDFKDLKGKRIPFVAGSPSPNVNTEGALAWGGLTWNDVKKVELFTFTQLYAGIIEGKLDATIMSGTSSDAFKMETSPHGIYWIPMPPDNKAGWDAFHKFEPTGYPVLFGNGGGAGLSDKDKIWLHTWQYPLYATYPNIVSEDYAYWITKEMVEAYPLYMKAASDMPGLDPVRIMKLPSTYVWHPGSIRYLKEVGLWTPYHETNQQGLLAREGKLMDLWNKTVAEAADKKLKDAEFAKFWLDKRAAAFPAYYVAQGTPPTSFPNFTPVKTP